MDPADSRHPCSLRSQPHPCSLRSKPREQGSWRLCATWYEGSSVKFKAFVRTRSCSLKPANLGPSEELEASKTGPARRDSGPGWQDRPLPTSPHIGMHSKWQQTAPWLGSKEVGPPPWAQDELCYRNTTCLLHFLLKQDTLHPPDQSAQHGSREEAPAPGGPTQDGPSRWGLWPHSWTLGPASSCSLLG